MGRAIAERLVLAGANVIAGDVLDAVDELGVALPDQVHSGELDVAVAKSWELLFGAGLARFGRLDALVNNAGVLRRRSIERETADEFERVWRVNCLGAFLGIQAVVPHLRQSPHGAIVNTPSTAATTVWTEYGAYSSSKWGLRGLTKVAALELAEDNIRVNAIVPGTILTPMVANIDDPEAAVLLGDAPLGRVGLPSDIAEVALFLISDRSGFMTGSELIVDGGMTVGTVSRRSGES
jgi:3alpha(or 20beta)-hydroxysteroid dehydrogenase